MKINGTLFNDNIIGTSDDDEIYGYVGNDTIHGGDGNDIIDGGIGENWLYGDGGNDTIYSKPTSPLFYQVDHVDGGTGTDTLYLYRDFVPYGWSSLSLDISDPAKTATLQDGTTITGIEGLRFWGGDESDFVTGGIGYNVLNGGDGADVLTGGPLGDVIDGGAGADRLYGLGGDDYFFSIGLDPDKIDGGDGIDTAEINRSSATMAYNFALHSNSQTPQDIGDGTTLVRVERMVFWGGSGADVLTAGDYGDTLHGGGGSDQLYDGKGNDTLDGGDHNDQIYSRSGFDTIDGGNGNDLLFLSRIWSSQNIHLDLTDPSTPQTIGDGGTQQTPHGNILLGTSVVNVESVVFEGGLGNDVVTGGRLSDTLNGGWGNDTLCGGTQSGGILNIDRLDGGPGNDTLIGGPGTDYFIFDAPLIPANVDHIVNFNVAGDRGIQPDKILLDDAVFADLTPNMSETAFDALVKEAANGDLFYEGHLFAHLDGAPQLLFSNFQVYYEAVDFP